MRLSARGFDRRAAVGLLLIVVGLPVAGCGGGSSASSAAGASKASPPATVGAPRTEASLTTITLTDEAVKRLGIETGTIAQRGVARTRIVSGDIVAPGGAQGTITAPFAGRLEPGPAPVVVGATVAKGATILRLVALSPGDRDTRIEAERLASEAEGRHAMAAKRAERAQQLARDGSGSRRAAEEAEADLVAASAALKAARDRLALAARQMTTTGAIPLDAPYAALLRAVHANAGQTVAAGAPLFELVRLDTMWIRVPLFGAEADEVDVRAAARIVPIGAPATAAGIEAKPVAAPPSADPASASIDLYFAVPNAAAPTFTRSASTRPSVAGPSVATSNVTGSNVDGAAVTTSNRRATAAAPNPGARFRPGQRVGVVLALRGDAPRLVAPRAALLYDAHGGAWVYEMRDAHTFVRRRIDVADLVDDWAVVAQGPPAGTRVVTAGAAELFGTEFGVGK